MQTALTFSLEMNILKKKDYQLIINHIKNLNLSISINKFFTIKELKKILFFMLKDKKNKSDKISLVLLNRIGSALIDKEYSKKSLKLFLNNYLRN